ncbi:MAG: ABC transporter permease subunit [Cytophagales bacterium]|nr:ABC transporter permease subunit [Cytophagales bacterium]
MKSIWIITKRELASFFDSPIAYAIIIVFLGLSGFFTWLYGSTIFLINQASLEVFFSIAFWIFVLFIPAITMRTIAEENKSGTIELLITRAVTDWQIVFGKFLSCLILIVIAILASVPYYITVSILGPIDHGAVLGGYFGLILISAAFISIGVFVSSASNNQFVAFLVTFIICLVFHIIFEILANYFTGVSGDVLNYLSIRNHFDSIKRGVVDSRDLIYFLSIITLGLILAQTMLSKRNWQG